VARPLVVEFVGLPGVGKSHATRLVAARLDTHGTPVRSAALRINEELGVWRRRLSKARFCAAEAVARPRSTLRVIRALLRSGQRDRLDVIRLLYNWLFVSRMLRHARTQPSIELLDEGIFQLLWSIGFAGAEQSIRECAALLHGEREGIVCMPHVVVLVEAPHETVQARLAARGSRAGRVDRLSSDEHPAALQRGVDLLAEVLSETVGLTPLDGKTLLRRVRNGAPHELEADLDALVDELAALAAR
jgi:hypothetical protein